MFRTKTKWVELFEKGVILQAILTLGIVGVCLYLFASGQEVNPVLVQWAGFMMGLYGAAKVNNLRKRSDK